MKPREAALAIVFGLAALPGSAAARSADRCGPADDPFEWPDFGGTPDTVVSAHLGLEAAEVETLLEGLDSPSAEERAAAVEEIRRQATGSEGTMREVLWRDHGARNIEMRRAVQSAHRKVERSSGASPSSLLDALLEEDPRAEDQGAGVRGATRIMALLEALRGLNTMAGYKIMLEFSGRHAGVFRHEIGRMFADSGFDSLPALVYGRKSSDRETHMFAVKWIRDMGNPLLGEQVRAIENPRRLAQLIEAYASVNDLGAVEVTLALANHESVFVRCAARSSLERYGVNARWPLRRQYENTFSREPKPGTGFESWREDLYAHYDSVRMAPAMEIFTRGLGFAGEGDTARMSDCFDEVLRDYPMFPRRDEMAEGYLAHAAALERAGDMAGSKRAAMKALRVSEQGSEQALRARALQGWLRAESMRSRGVLDIEGYRRLGRFAPDSRLAARRLAEGGDGGSRRKLVFRAVAVSVALFIAGLLTLARMGLLWRDRRGAGFTNGS